MYEKTKLDVDIAHTYSAHKKSSQSTRKQIVQFMH